MGDKNATFFHKHASSRKFENQIRSLKRENGQETKEDEMDEIVRDYFQNLFTFNGVGNMAHILEGIEQVISYEINVQLATPFLEKVRETSKEIG